MFVLFLYVSGSFDFAITTAVDPAADADYVVRCLFNKIYIFLIAYNSHHKS